MDFKSIAGQAGIFLALGVLWFLSLWRESWLVAGFNYSLILVFFFMVWRQCVRLWPDRGAVLVSGLVGGAILALSLAVWADRYEGDAILDEKGRPMFWGDGKDEVYRYGRFNNQWNKYSRIIKLKDKDGGGITIKVNIEFSIDRAGRGFGHGRMIHEGYNERTHQTNKTVSWWWNDKEVSAEEWQVLENN